MRVPFLLVIQIVTKQNENKTAGKKTPHHNLRIIFPQFVGLWQYYQKNGAQHENKKHEVNYVFH
jgi:hypothetical protein